jgi:hypothetical protein
VALVLLIGGEPGPSLAAAAPVTFTDVTGLAGIPTSNLTTWALEWGDYDNDGHADLFVSHHFARPALYHNNGDGTFTNMVRQAGMTIKTDWHACAWGDYNADRFLDLYCQTGARMGTSSLPKLLFRNNMNGTFTDVAVELGVDDGPGRGRTVNWLDYNGDQHLDLYISNMIREGFPSRLFRGLSGTFVDVSVEAGVADIVRLNRGGGSAWADYDGDDDPDLLVAAQFKLILHQNRGDGTFTANSASAAGLTARTNRSAGWGDFDNDGDLDLFVARNQGIEQSILYQNNGDGTFSDITAPSGTAVSNANLGLWGDYDNDGDLDLFVARNYDATLDVNPPDALFINNGDGTFADFAPAAGVTGPTIGAGNSVAWADYNEDGFLDLFVTNGEPMGTTHVPPGPMALYRNNGNGNHWLELKLRGSTNNTFGYGAKVWITAGGKTQFRQLTDGVVHRAQSDQLLHFGLDSATSVDEISIRWPNGQMQLLTSVSADQILTVGQP